MTDVMRWLSSNVIAALSIFGAAVAFTVSTWQQVSQRRAERDERQFQAFHRVVEGVVSPDPKGGLHYVDRQAAVIFELRHFPRYYDFTERMLMRLKTKWTTEPEPHSNVLVEEIDLALKHIQRNK
jgi:hypothetical protein